jgi:hypothetical protein
VKAKYEATIDVLIEYRARLHRDGDLRKEMTAEDAKELWTDISDSISELEKAQGVWHEERGETF